MGSYQSAYCTSCTGTWVYCLQMPLLSSMAGILLDFLIVALVGSSFLLSMVFLTPKMDFQVLDTGSLRYVDTIL